MNSDGGVAPAHRPLTAILSAFEEGASSPAEVARRTGLTMDTVSAGVAHLVRIGRLAAEEFSLGCPPQGCGGCVVADKDGSCASAVGRVPGRPLVALSLRRQG